MTIRITTVIGARPQFVKAAALSRALQKHAPEIKEFIVHTGQHFDASMSDVFFNELNIPAPAFTLDIQGGSHGQMTGRMLEAVENTLIQNSPQAVLVYGDTNSTLAGALAASKLHIPIIHVEAGLRSYNRKMPEEINRVLTDHMSSLLFCPTKTAVNNLRKEGILDGVYHVGDIMYDATLHAIHQLKQNPSLTEKLKALLPNNFVFMTIHRAESTHSTEKFRRTLEFAKTFSHTHNCDIIFPVHPRTRALVDSLSESLKDHFIFMSPLSYLETQFCLMSARYVLTDSGGLQKEAYFHRVPCITLRSETEWVETIEHGWNRLWTMDHDNPRTDILEYGNGRAAEKMVEKIRQALN